jgi:hypothetical protein
LTNIIWRLRVIGVLEWGFWFFLDVYFWAQIKTLLEIGFVGAH